MNIPPIWHSVTYWLWGLQCILPAFHFYDMCKWTYLQAQTFKNCIHDLSKKNDMSNVLSMFHCYVACNRTTCYRTFQESGITVCKKNRGGGTRGGERMDLTSFFWGGLALPRLLVTFICTSQCSVGRGHWGLMKPCTGLLKRADKINDVIFNACDVKMAKSNCKYTVLHSIFSHALVPRTLWKRILHQWTKKYYISISYQIIQEFTCS